MRAVEAVGLLRDGVEADFSLEQLNGQRAVTDVFPPKSVLDVGDGDAREEIRRYFGIVRRDFGWLDVNRPMQSFLGDGVLDLLADDVGIGERCVFIAHSDTPCYASVERWHTR